MDWLVPRRLRPYRHLLDAFHFAATIADASSHDCPVIWANTRFFALTGYPPEAVLGRNCRFLQTGRTNEKARRRLRAAIASRRPIDTLVENVTADGRLFLNHLIVRPLDGAGDLLVGVQNDVTGWIAFDPPADPIPGAPGCGSPPGELRAVSLAKWMDRLARVRVA
jgi:PAS domain S-box-containing protein